MQSALEREIRSLVIVLGCGEVGSAIAHRLHRDGFAVVLIDDIDPPWARRGRAFTDAWYLGTCELEGVAAVFCASVRSIPSVLYRGHAIAATTWSWPGVAAALQADGLIDARVRSNAGTSAPSMRIAGAHAIGVGDGFHAGRDVDAVVAFPAEASHGAMRLESMVAGRFTTGRHVGDQVCAGDTVGAVHGEPLIAPCNGSLCSLTARGARVAAGTLLAEIDPRGSRSACFGIEARERALADDVLETLNELQRRDRALSEDRG